MKAFMDKDFLLETETAKQLYHQHAAKMPIVDYHCHINPQEIAEDKHYATITELWLGADHYKWRNLRANGVPEADIACRETDPYRTFLRWAQALPRAIGNPLYHWTYLELQRYFGVTGPLNPRTCKDVYDRCNARLHDADMSVRGIIDQSNVTLICTTDDPVDTLEWHKKIKADPTCRVKVLPAFRPDQALNLTKPTFAAYVKRLSEVSGVAIDSFAGMTRALAQRVRYFDEAGCRASDHGLDYCMYAEAEPAALDAILAKALAGEAVTDDEAEAYRTALLCALAQQYTAHGWVMQLHFGCIRNNNTEMFRQLGPDTGFDAVSNSHGVDSLAKLLDAFNSAQGGIPKMVLYSLNQYDNEAIATIAGCFQQNADCAGRIQLGSAWWFNDTKTGMQKQLTDLANLGSLGNFIGMLTDSRSFLSYTRHEYFRRILCNWIGNLVENGEYENDPETLGALVEDISYNNAMRFFGFAG
ncbi:MAG: glucuronate isomerase [Ruthenibacterium sp.]